MLRRAQSHRCAVNTLGILACNFSMCLSFSHRNSMFLRFLEGILENRVQSLNGVIDFSQENF